MLLIVLERGIREHMARQHTNLPSKVAIHLKEKADDTIDFNASFNLLKKYNMDKSKII